MRWLLFFLLLTTAAEAQPRKLAASFYDSLGELLVQVYDDGEVDIIGSEVDYAAGLQTHDQAWAVARIIQCTQTLAKCRPDMQDTKEKP